MSTDLFEELAQTQVPPALEQLDRAVHARVNKALAAAQLIDFAVRALPWAALEMLAALGYWLLLTIGGRLPAPPRRDGDRGADGV